MLVIGGMVLAVGVVGDQDLLLHRRVLKEFALAVLEDADHAVGKSLDVNNLVQRVAVRKKCFAQIVADDRHVLAVVVFGFGEIAADVRFRVVDVGIVNVRAGIIQAANFLVLVARGDHGRAVHVIDALHHRYGNFLHRRALFADGLRVFIGQRLAVALLGGHAAGVDA